MSYPTNPESIILRNSFYPNGLKEIDIWNYYQKEKSRILKETMGRDVILYLGLDTGIVVIRKTKKEKKPIILTNTNYDNIITGRTISIHSCMKAYEDIGIIDIDCDNFKLAKQATLDTFNFVVDNLNFVNRVIIRYTGKTGFHILCKLGKKVQIDSIRFLLKRSLSNSILTNKYTIESKRKKGIPNLDLSSNKFNGGFITLHSLSVIGLRCVEVKPNNILNFQQHSVKI